MFSGRYRFVSLGFIAIAVVWLLAWGAYRLAGNSKVTADKVRAFVAKTDLRQLSGEARKKALRNLAAKLNALPPDERRKARVERFWNDMFEQMTEEEKGEFIEATMPTGFKQMLAAFEQLPEDKRQRAVQDSIRRMRETREALAAQEPANPALQNTNAPVLSDDLQKRVVTVGLKSFYGESSARTKAELAPLLEEMQKSMESGNLFRGARRQQPLPDERKE